MSYVPIIEMIGSLDEAEREYQRAARGLPRSGPIMALADVARRRGHTDDECAFLAKTVDLLRGRPILPLQLLADAEMRGPPGRGAGRDRPPLALGGYGTGLRH